VLLGVTARPPGLPEARALVRGPPYNSWYVGNIAEINKCRTKMENVSVEFKDDTYGVTRGTFVAEADTPTAQTSSGWCSGPSRST